MERLRPADWLRLPQLVAAFISFYFTCGCLDMTKPKRWEAEQRSPVATSTASTETSPAPQAQPQTVQSNLPAPDLQIRGVSPLTEQIDGFVTPLASTTLQTRMQDLKPLFQIRSGAAILRKFLQDPCISPRLEAKEMKRTHDTLKGYFNIKATECMANTPPNALRIKRYEAIIDFVLNCKELDKELANSDTNLIQKLQAGELCASKNQTFGMRIQEFIDENEQNSPDSVSKSINRTYTLAAKNGKACKEVDNKAQMTLETTCVLTRRESGYINDPNSETSEPFNDMIKLRLGNAIYSSSQEGPWHKEGSVEMIVNDWSGVVKYSAPNVAPKYILRSKDMELEGELLP